MVEWIVAAMERTGLVGVALLMLGENVFPPVPSELIMPLAGFAAAQGKLTYVGVMIAGTIGSLLGAYVWYEVGRRVGAERLKRWTERHGRWMTMAPEEVDQATAWFKRHGGWAVMVGRIVPGVRTLISVPAGVAEMPRLPFLAWSAAGTVVWVGFLVAAGALLESQYHRVATWVDPIGTVLLIGFVGYYIYRVVTFGRRSPAADSSRA